MWSRSLLNLMRLRVTRRWKEQTKREKKKEKGDMFVIRAEIEQHVCFGKIIGDVQCSI